jgi:hypothetical protein
VESRTSPRYARSAAAFIRLAKNRYGLQSWGLVISQNYALGQFCCADAPLRKKEYDELLAREPEPLGEE